MASRKNKMSNGLPLSQVVHMHMRKSFIWTSVTGSTVDVDLANMLAPFANGTPAQTAKLQPPYYDELAALYGRYRVKKVRVDVEVLNLSNSTVIQGALWNRNNITAVTDVEDVISQDGARPIMANGIYLRNNKASVTVDLAKAFGRPLGDSDSAAVNAAPTAATKTYISLVLQVLTGTAFSASAFFDIYYDVEFFGRATAGLDS